MAIDLLNRDAVDRNLLRIGREGMQGRKVIGVKYEPRSKTWFLVLKNGLRAVIRVDAELHGVTDKAKPRTVRVTHRKKK